MSIRQAILTNDIHSLRIALSQGFDINATDESGWTPLHLSVAMSRYNVVKLLLDLGADVHLRDASGRAPFDYASMREDRDMIELLRSRSRELDEQKA